MRFKKLVEAVEFSLPESPPTHMYLLHGTSSAKLPKLQSVGLRVPRGELRDFAYSLATEYLNGFGFYENIPNELRKMIEDYLSGTRVGHSAISSQTEDKCIYMTGDDLVATRYAQNVAKYGSEVREYMHKLVVKYLAGIKVLDKRNPIPTPFSESDPIIVGAVVPYTATSDAREWEKNYPRYLDIAKSKQKQAQKTGDYSATIFNLNSPTGFLHYQTFCLNSSQYKDSLTEILVYQDIPASQLHFGFQGFNDDRATQDAFYYRVIPW